MKICKVYIVLLWCGLITAETTLTPVPSFVKKNEPKKEKNVEKKLIELSKELFDVSADVTILLTEWTKQMSDSVFEALDSGNKKEMSVRLADLKQSKQELLEIRKKIDTLQ